MDRNLNNLIQDDNLIRDDNFVTGGIKLVLRKG